MSKLLTTIRKPEYITVEESEDIYPAGIGKEKGEDNIITVDFYEASESEGTPSFQLKLSEEDAKWLGKALVRWTTPKLLKKMEVKSGK